MTDNPDPSVTDQGRRYPTSDGRDGFREGSTTDPALTILGRRTGAYRRLAHLAAQPIPVVVLERVEEQQ
ncbi:hypothetical protein ACIBEH_03330 [Nocardia salmonicida]|uniref:hypothetical protein n=1 Tax=Nocardia salmonicida TaxID=53431 RepID=UPI0033E85612